MIRAEELMIGDWAMDNPNVFIEDEYEPTKECFPTKINSGEDIDLAIEGCYTPIPITPEILERNEFKQEDDDCYLWNENLERIIWFNDGYTVITSVKCDRVYEGHCDNIHELQHALRLCGITKNIEL